MGHSEIAGKLFLDGYNCAQAVFCAYSDDLGLDKDIALKLSSSFGGGMGRLREVCGAVSGAFMVLGVMFGYSTCDDNNAKMEHYKLVQDYAAKFKEKYPSIVCREILKKPNGVENPMPQIRDEMYYKTRPCLYIVEYAAVILDEFIKENLK